MCATNECGVSHRNARLRVLHLGKFDTLGGIERHVRTLASGLASTGEVEVINLVSSNAAGTSQHENYGYPTMRAANVGTLFSLALSPTLPLLARQLHRVHHFDIVHLHFPDPLGQLAAGLLPRNVRRVITWHSDIVKQRWALAAYQPFVSSFTRNADALIGATPQHFSTSQQIPLAKPGQIREVIPYGFDPRVLAWSPESRRKRGELARQRGVRPLIFAVGRHVYYKGFDVLIRCMRELDADLWIGGQGPLTGTLERAVRDLNLADKVRFVGFIPDDLLVAYYDVCDVFCMPSIERSEQFGLVQLEAMYCSKPVIATKLGTGVEHVTIDGETGLLVAPKDDQALANALKRLFADPALRARLGASGQHRVKELFSVEQMVNKTIDLYRRVLDRRLAPSVR